MASRRLISLSRPFCNQQSPHIEHSSRRRRVRPGPTRSSAVGGGRHSSLSPNCLLGRFASSLFSWRIAFFPCTNQRVPCLCLEHLASPPASGTTSLTHLDGQPGRAQCGRPPSRHVAAPGQGRDSGVGLMPICHLQDRSTLCSPQNQAVTIVAKRKLSHWPLRTDRVCRTGDKCPATSTSPGQ